MPSRTLVSAGANSAALLLNPWAGLVLTWIAGGLTWGLIQATHPVFHVPEQYHAAMGAGEAAFAANRRAQDLVERNHAMLYVGSLGLLIGGLLAAREASLRRSLLPLIAAPLGALGGMLGGFLGCLVHEYVRREIGQAELMHTIAAQSLLAVPLGLGVGLGLGPATRTISGAIKTTLGGIIAGALAGTIYPVAVSILIPTASTDNLLPEERLTRIFWLAVVAGAIGLVIPIAARQRKRQSEASVMPAKESQPEA
jgi:hypothetical protein